LAATAEAQLDSVDATVTAASAALSTAQADAASAATSAAELVLTAQQEAALAATGQAAAESVLATATAETDRLAFALLAAQEDLTLALDNIDDRATAIAFLESDLATSQASGVGALPTVVATGEPTEQTSGAGSDELPPLTGDFASEAGDIAFSYPDGWLALQLENGVMLVGSTEDAILRDGTMLEGEYLVQMVINFVTNINDLPAGSTPTDVAEELAELFASPPNPATLGAVSELTIGGRQAAVVSGEENGNAFRLFVTDLGNDLVLIAIAFSTPETMEAFEPLVVDMLASFEFDSSSTNP
jgi:hypothetical protein